MSRAGPSKMKLATLLADMIGLLAENGWIDGAVLGTVHTVIGNTSSLDGNNCLRRV